MDIWEKRRRNLRAIMAVKGMNASTVATNAGLSINTFGKFLRGETKTMRWDTLEAVSKEIGISNPAVLDADNPFSEVKNRLYAIIDEMSDDQAEQELQRILSNQQ